MFPPSPHTFPHVSLIASPVSFGVSPVSSGVSPCFLFEVLRQLIPFSTSISKNICWNAYKKIDVQKNGFPETYFKRTFNFSTLYFF